MDVRIIRVTLTIREALWEHQPQRCCGNVAFARYLGEQANRSSHHNATVRDARGTELTRRPRLVGPTPAPARKVTRSPVHNSSQE